MKEYIKVTRQCIFCYIPSDALPKQSVILNKCLVIPEATQLDCFIYKINENGSDAFEVDFKCSRGVVRPIILAFRASYTGSNPVGSTNLLVN